MLFAHSLNFVGLDVVDTFVTHDGLHLTVFNYGGELMAADDALSRYGFYDGYVPKAERRKPTHLEYVAKHIKKIG